ncbi:MAG: tRNA uridine-5-carboxymethylaminomethyl(34) synthesis GTPase MnmE [Salinisphaera sp.]|jgi:tRNA modification GTPase|nr:tRNA uridine-5-carboxymethylaminomethyl(34) synthesis GTPase MnmE [Salinisphaera sp.]
MVDLSQARRRRSAPVAGQELTPTAVAAAAVDTIAALASGAGQAGVAVIRVSGPAVPAIAQDVLGTLPAPRQAALGAFLGADGLAIDHGLALYFPAPYSFTGEHVLELQGHGGRILVDMLLARLLACGARLARAGEFSERAFFNDKISLDQAEAIADAIAAGSTVTARAAVRSLEGAFSREIDALVADLIALRVYTEGAIDFPDEEDVDFLGDGEIKTRLDALITRLTALQSRAVQGAGFRDGLRVVILGQPNVGKSSLLNRLAQRDTAIVTAIAGTTRDVLSEQLSLDGLPLTVVDTAGLRETDDPIEAEGVRRARREINQADHVLLVTDASRPLDAAEQRLLAEIGQRVSVTILANKIDLAGLKPGRHEVDGYALVALSALDGQGLDTLAIRLKQVAGVAADGEPAFVARRRHLDALARAAAALKRGDERLTIDAAGELLAEELSLAQATLGEITGQVTSDDLLGAIFSSFCIGK